MSNVSNTVMHENFDLSDYYSLFAEEHTVLTGTDGNPVVVGAGGVTTANGFTDQLNTDDLSGMSEFVVVDDAGNMGAFTAGGHAFSFMAQNRTSLEIQADLFNRPAVQAAISAYNELFPVPNPQSIARLVWAVNALVRDNRENGQPEMTEEMRNDPEIQAKMGVLTERINERRRAEFLAMLRMLASEDGEDEDDTSEEDNEFFNSLNALLQ